MCSNLCDQTDEDTLLALSHLSSWTRVQNLRPNPCNNKPPLTVLYTGDVVYDLLTAYQSGCGYTYVQVLWRAVLCMYCKHPHDQRIHMMNCASHHSIE